ncbi:hypothetical protein PRK78_002165 [Emydomyces testavorans]|uniref:BTB domain-containing protein n=1 Tax=Emydomyces testavorans TaxID=2070801 RepID=A0AAF0DDP2_9EURO|nr:hypothetical protein PRK78_002165 [Emydomyces testavorans]
MAMMLNNDFEYDSDSLEVDFALPTPEECIGYLGPMWKFLTTPILNIQVGTDEREVFLIHQGLLTAHSGFFRGLLRHNLREKEEGIVKLPEDDVKTFAMFAQWLYTGDCASDEIAASETKSPDLEIELPLRDLSSVKTETDDETFNFPLLFSAYVLADKIEAPAFRWHIHDEITLACEAKHPQLSLDDIRYVYQNTREDDLVRNFCIRQTCGRDLQKNLEDPEFLSVCEEIPSFGVSVLKQCSKRLKVLTGDSAENTKDQATG